MFIQVNAVYYKPIQNLDMSKCVLCLAREKGVILETQWSSTQ